MYAYFFSKVQIITVLFLISTILYTQNPTDLSGNDLLTSPGSMVNILIKKKDITSVNQIAELTGNEYLITHAYDIAEKRLPQDGRIFYNKNAEKFDIRVSILPTLYGEKIVLRLLTNNLSNVQITELGFQENDLINYLESIRKPNGLVLISGPMDKADARLTQGADQVTINYYRGQQVQMVTYWYIYYNNEFLGKLYLLQSDPVKSLKLRVGKLALGAAIELGFMDERGKNVPTDFDWIQTVKSTGKENKEFRDGFALPFYYKSVDRATLGRSSTSGKLYTARIWDGPFRSDRMNLTWIAQTSLVLKVKNGYARLITIEWGFILQQNSLDPQVIVPQGVTPSQFHLDAIRKAKPR
jgi:hypothetical protein